MTHSGLLRNVYLFKSLTDKELETVLALGHSQPFSPGDEIFLKGEPAKALYLIKLGTINIQQNGNTVATLATGSHFGEMAFVDGEPRSATAVAGDRGDLVVLPYEKLDSFLKSNPAVAVKIYREMAHFLAGRLRVTTSDLSFAREKNLSHM